MRPKAIATLTGLSSVLAVAVFLALPTNLESWFDGLPWSHQAETMAALGLIPLLTLLGYGFLQRRHCLPAMALLLAIKLALALCAPAGGWAVKVYATPEDVARGKWERTYSTLWRPGLSETLTDPWTQGPDFPIEWMNRGPVPPKGGFWLGVQVRGFVRLPPGAGLALAADGLAGADLTAVDPEGRARPVPVVKEPTQAAHLDPESLPRRSSRIEGLLRYDESGNWSLMPLLVYPGGRVEPAFGHDALWRGEEGVTISTGPLGAWRVLARASDLGFLAWLAAWAGWTLWSLWRRDLLDIPLALTAALVWFLPGLLEGFFPDLAYRLSLGIAVNLAAVGLICLAWLRPKPWEDRASRLGTIMLVVLGPGVLAWFMRFYAAGMGSMNFFTQGNDWLTYQNLARSIFLTGDWLDSADEIWHMQPLYRYVVGLAHAIFGQSPVAQHLLDVWSALAGASLTASVAGLLGLNPAWAFLAAGLFLAPEFLSLFRYHIGSGLQEHLAMALMMLTAWATLRWWRTSWSGVVAAGVLAVLGYWMRQDHLGVLAALGVLGLANAPGGLVQAWRGWLRDLWRNRARLALYLGVLGAGVLAVGLRNWWFGGLFTLTSPDNLSFLRKMNLSGIPWNLYVVLFANEGPALWPAWVLVPGTLSGLIALALRWGPLRDYPLSLGVCLAGLLAPYLLVRASAYPPRFSLHLLPLAAISLALVLSRIFRAWRSDH